MHLLVVFHETSLLTSQIILNAIYRIFECLGVCAAPLGLDNVLTIALPPLTQWATIVLPLTGHDKDTPSGCNNRSPLRERWVKRNTYCFSPVGATQPG